MNNKGMWHGNNSKTWSMYKTKKEQRRNKSKPRSTHRTSPYTCTEDCATPSLQTSQFFSLTSQLWEMQNMVEMLHNHISEANWECNAAQCHADHAIWVSWLLWNNPTTLCESLCMAGCLLCWWRMCHMVDWLWWWCVPWQWLTWHLSLHACKSCTTRMCIIILLCTFSSSKGCPAPSTPLF